MHPAVGSYALLLAAIGDNGAIEPLAKLLALRESGDSNVRARRDVAEALGRFRDPRARAALLDAIKDDPAWEVYHAARQALNRMDGQIIYPYNYETLSAKVALAVTKQPEPTNGAEAVVQSWRDAHNGGLAGRVAWTGPKVEDYASKTDIERARNTLVEIGKTGDYDVGAGGVVELLMEYLRNLKLWNDGRENAQMLLIRIGKPAIPALENGVKRGDSVMARYCQQCIEAIKAPEAATPAKGN
jgi:hypothetical protein